MSGFGGQWVGKSSGDPEGQIVIDFDVVGDFSIGTAFLNCNQRELPSVTTEFTIPNSLEETEFDTKILPFNPDTGIVISNERDFKQIYPEQTISRSAHLKVKILSDKQMNVEWSTDIGTFGKSTLSLTAPPKDSIIPAEDSVGSWREFKDFVSSQKFRDNIFRGQNYPYALQTSFHRTKRKRLTHYNDVDVRELHRSITNETNRECQIFCV